MSRAGRSGLVSRARKLAAPRLQLRQRVFGGGERVALFGLRRAERAPRSWIVERAARAFDGVRWP